uniref:Uncharacterized protein n=1 Tax=Ganoderma tsugae TaxID=2075311 RepID=A0A2S1WBL5_GANTS|nr:hypothetical protein [Ganoderma tsugae]AWJ63862.1 hypothetical protein [Ganoderma tsugae]
MKKYIKKNIPLHDKKNKEYMDSKGNVAVLNYLINNKQSQNLLGTIIGFKKGWRKNRSNDEYYSFLLYYSHETGRIERYLYNSGTKTPLSFEFISDTNNTYYSPLSARADDNKVIISKTELEKYLNPKSVNIQNLYNKYPLKTLNFKLLTDGKLNKDFFNMFIIELLRDYLIFFTSFRTQNMNFLRTFTKPYFDISPIEYLKDYKLGCGQPDYVIIEEELRLFLKDKTNNIDIERAIEVAKIKVEPINATKFIDYSIGLPSNMKKQFLINVPKNFNTKYNQDLFSNFNFNLVSLEKKDLPQCIVDLKSYINE